MEEKGRSLKDHSSKILDQYLGHIPLRIMITVCNRAEEGCPTYLSMDTKLHGGFPDLVTFHDSEEEKLEMF